MQILRSLAALNDYTAALKGKGQTLGFVPTMGALHDGHLSLVELAEAKVDKVLVSIFVNPAQFAPHEDFDHYPRQEQDDLAKLAGISVDAVYLPTREDIYPNGIDESFTVGPIGKILDGKPRPHFFDGVGQVVLRFFEQVRPDLAVFGEKDFQQLTIIQKLVKAKNMPVEVMGAPICREADGLAMSSRNVYLSKEQRAIAPALYRVLLSVKEAVHAGKNVESATDDAVKALLAAGFDAVDYIQLRDARTLEPWSKASKAGRILGAARLGTTRLIDNIAL